MLTVGDKNIADLKTYNLAIQKAQYRDYAQRDISSLVLPKSTEVFGKQPYLSKIKQYHKKQYDLWTILIMPLFLAWHNHVIKNEQLRLVILEATK